MLYRAKQTKPRSPALTGKLHLQRHTLEALGVEVVFRWEFGDHHAYRPAELRRLAVQASAAGAQALVTTEKDVMNLCQNAAELLQPHKLFWLKIGVEIENEQELLRRIL